MRETTPALTPKEWEDVEGDGPFPWRHSTVEGVTHLDASDRHAAAALALHCQPFGFTWADVDALRYLVQERSGALDTGLDVTVASIADRIAALLPPREGA